MKSDAHENHGRRFLHVAKEYLTHWTVAGSIVVLTGFGQEHSFADIIGHLAPEKIAHALQGFDLRVVLVAIGVALIAWDVLRRSAAQREGAQPAGHPESTMSVQSPGEGREDRKEAQASVAAAPALHDRACVLRSLLLRAPRVISARLARSRPARRMPPDRRKTGTGRPQHRAIPARRP